MIRVLLIEDDIIDQKAFLREVNSPSITSHLVSSVKEAREYLKQNTYEIIVADYWLGDGTAFDILREFPAIPMIIITSVGDEDTAVQAIKMGAYDYLVKDLDLAYLKKIPVAIENAVAHQKLVAAERDQRAFADALRDIATVLNASLELEEVLNRILQNVQRVVPHDASNIMLIKDGEAEVMHSWNCFASRSSRVVIAQEKHLHQMLTTRQPMILPDAKINRDCLFIHGQNGQSSPLHGYAGTPISVGENVIGFLNLYSAAAHFYTPRHAERLQAFADHAAVALENARLYQQAKELAAFQERQRLARNLHDSVTQTLFSAHAFSEAILKLWEADPGSIGPQLNQLNRLTRGALAEMRTLLLELRPQSLLESDLVDLLRQLGDNMAGRSSTQVLVKAPPKCPLPPDVHIAFYRIAQEALGNVEKHSQAKQVTLELLKFQEQVILYIEDDGKGFDIHRPGLKKVGLTAMNAHAQTVNMMLVIHSAPGKGTRVMASWQTPG